MILTGAEITREVGRGRVHIDDFDPARVEPNSYGFRLGDTLLEYVDEVLDPYRPPHAVATRIGPEGVILQPGRLYLGSTAESMGSPHYAATLYARRSLSTLGVWIQYSAPLGHCGAVIPWTLEIKVAQPVRLFAGMLVGKIAFWAMLGDPVRYEGRYTGSTGAVASRLSLDNAGWPAGRTS